MKISAVVNEILSSDLIDYHSAAAGYFNFSSYSRKIQPKLEKKLFKPVELRSVVVALSRIARNIRDAQNWKPIELSDISLKNNLALFTVAKSQQALQEIAIIGEQAIKGGEYFNTTVGSYEISVVGSEKSVTNIINVTKQKILYSEKNLVGLSISLAGELQHRPGTIHDILGKMRIKNIDIGEIISTSTEVTIILQKKFLTEALTQLSADFSS